MIHGATFTLSLSAFALLLLAMVRHQQDWLGRKLPPSRSRHLRLGGFTLLGVAFFTSGTGLGWSYGAVVWFGWMTMAAMIIVAANVNREWIMGMKR